MVYTPEDGINLDMLRQDVKYMKRRFLLDEKGKAEGRLVIKWVDSFVTTLFVTYALQERSLLKCL
jgi:6-phosphofructokinase 1